MRVKTLLAITLLFLTGCLSAHIVEREHVVDADSPSQLENSAGVAKSVDSFKACNESYIFEAQVCKELYTSTADEADTTGPDICLQAVERRLLRCAKEGDITISPSADDSSHEDEGWSECVETFAMHWQSCEDVFSSPDEADRIGLQFCQKALGDKLATCPVAPSSAQIE